MKWERLRIGLMPLFGGFLVGSFYRKPSLAGGFLLLGVVLNLLAVYGNGERMPVLALSDEMADAVRQSPIHTFMWDGTRFKLLCDIIPLGRTMMSIGDILLYIGLAMWWVQSIRFIASLWWR